MTRVRAIVAEDEAPQRDALCRMLAQAWPALQICAVCSDGQEAIDALHAQRPDVAILDIRMPGPSGIEVACLAIAQQCQVLFTTAYDEYAVHAFEAGAIDYLLKPIRPDRLQLALARLQQRLHSATQPDIAALTATLAPLFTRSKPSPLRWITASVGDTLRFVAIEEVLCFHAQDKLTRVLSSKGEAWIRTPLKELLPQLDPEEFWQVHRSLIVRASAIDRVRKDELGRYELHLRGQAERFPVAQSFAAKLRVM